MANELAKCRFGGYTLYLRSIPNYKQKHYLSYMEYKKDYRGIGFRVIYSVVPHMPWILNFAAQPYEVLLDMDHKEMNTEPSAYLVYGKVAQGERLEIGFKAFAFEMTQDLHNRLGLLYDKIKMEYRGVILKRT